MLNLIRTTTFRMALIYVAMFGLSALALLLFVYWNTVGFMARQTDETIMAEAQSLVEHHQEQGLSGLIRIIRERMERDETNIYYLMSPFGQRMDGNLDVYPTNAQARGRWIEFAYARALVDEEGETIGSEVHYAQARRVRLRGDFILLVGRDIADRRAIEGLITSALGWAAVLTLGLGVGGGVLISRSMMRRLEAVNRTSREVMAGDLSQRVKVTGSGDELDQLALNLNAMLDQIENLMLGMREVSDNIAHDLRSPLTRLRNRMEGALMRPARQDGDYRMALEDMIAEADNLLGTFNALLSIARLEAGEGGGAFAWLNLADIVDDLADLYEPVAQHAGVAFRTRNENAPQIKGSRELISQAVANLLDNALKFAETGGRVELRMSVIGENQVELAVIDDGPGVPDKDRDRVMKRFVRLEVSRSTPGSGLGLSLVSAIAKLHGATFSLSGGDLSTGRGPGLKAALVFVAGDSPGPRARLSKPGKSESEAAAPKSSAGAKKTVVKN